MTPRSVRDQGIAMEGFQQPNAALARIEGGAGSSTG